MLLCGIPARGMYCPVFRGGPVGHLGKIPEQFIQGQLMLDAPP